MNKKTITYIEDVKFKEVKEGDIIVMEETTYDDLSNRIITKKLYLTLAIKVGITFLHQHRFIKVKEKILYEHNSGKIVEVVRVK